MRRFLCLLSLCWGLSYCLSPKNEKLDAEWEAWKTTYGKNYSEKEESFRRQVWEKNLKLINDHNRLFKEGKKSYFMGMNQFGDMTDKEFESRLNLRIAPVRTRRNYTFKRRIYYRLPKSVDWRTHGYVTPIRNQGECGACWAFSTIGSLEGQLFRKTGRLVELSKQMLIDCSGYYTCMGGSLTGALDFIRRYGVVSERCYPYMNGQNWWCYRRQCPFVRIRDYVTLPSGDERALMQAVATVGPVAVAIHAPPSFRYYQGGPYIEPRCRLSYMSNMNHALLVVGYGPLERSKYEEFGLQAYMHKDNKFWIAKNSWGEQWGDRGYIYIPKDRYNQCGIASNANYPIL
ncbi:procathepsin L-like [Monodelphis domestica]|uniref:Cathepsin L1-like n=1 Tax=Monodelphis domestica TaxID=13616 RepID=F6STH0_MONDO|nr:procathepsin L-like [Monodelphis domestica]